MSRPTLLLTALLLPIVGCSGGSTVSQSDEEKLKAKLDAPLGSPSHAPHAANPRAGQTGAAKP